MTYVSRTERSEHDTWTLDVSPVDWDTEPIWHLPKMLAQELAPYGATIQRTVGIWDGELEDGARVTVHGPEGLAARVLSFLAHYNPFGWRMVHETRYRADGGAEVTFRDLCDYREYYHPIGDNPGPIGQSQ